MGERHQPLGQGRGHRALVALPGQQGRAELESSKGNLGSRGKSEARARGFPGFKTRTEERGGAAAGPSTPTANWGCGHGATPRSPRAGAGTPAHHPSGTLAVATGVALVLGATHAAPPVPRAASPATLPKTCLLASRWETETGLEGRAWGSAPASIQPLGVQVSTPKKQILCLTTWMQHLPGPGPCRIQLRSQQAACGAAQTLLRALQGARAVLTILDMAPRDCHITALHVASRCSDGFAAAAPELGELLSCGSQTQALAGNQLALPPRRAKGEGLEKLGESWRRAGEAGKKLEKDRPLPAPCLGPRPSAHCIPLPTWAAPQVTPCPGCPSRVSGLQYHWLPHTWWVLAP